MRKIKSFSTTKRRRSSRESRKSKNKSKKARSLCEAPDQENIPIITEVGKSIKVRSQTLLAVDFSNKPENTLYESSNIICDECNRNLKRAFHRCSICNEFFLCSFCVTLDEDARRSEHNCSNYFFISVSR
eukprot:TRINITY_DN10903_c0_g1_i1.p1 TRINITY_DN10903_c0_g1~~TRINITY_DN10903_c0_g1_i1.p1  ORF type:complete len:146 (+),score=16.59 TRINITY_DN10903_c0_g1_i1:49-438(+)